MAIHDAKTPPYRVTHLLYATTTQLDAMDDLEILSLTEGCTIDDIKRAFREIATYLHPDKARFHEFDPEQINDRFTRARKAHDELLSMLGGATARKMSENEMAAEGIVKNLLAEMLNVIVDPKYQLYRNTIYAYGRGNKNDSISGLIASTERSIKENITAIAELRARIKALGEARRKVACKKGVNLYNNMIDSLIERAEEGIAEGEHRIEINKLCINELSRFVDVDEEAIEEHEPPAKLEDDSTMSPL